MLDLQPVFGSKSLEFLQVFHSDSIVEDCTCLLQGMVHGTRFLFLSFVHCISREICHCYRINWTWLFQSCSLDPRTILVVFFPSISSPCLCLKHIGLLFLSTPYYLLSIPATKLDLHNLGLTFCSLWRLENELFLFVVKTPII